MKMKYSSKIKTIVFAVSLTFNGIVILFLILSLFSNTQFISMPKYENNFKTAASIISTSNNVPINFLPFEVVLNPGEFCFIQYSVLINKKQSNFFINSLYDPNIISVVNIPGYGIKITALAEGDTLLQTISTDGIADIVHVYVYKEPN